MALASQTGRLAGTMLAAVCLWHAVFDARGDVIIDVTIDGTDQYANSSNGFIGPFALDFQLTSTAAVGQNTATISGFNFGGGLADFTDAVVDSGGGSIDTTGQTITLNDAGSPANFFNEAILPLVSLGTSLSFEVDLTTNEPAGAGQFSFLIQQDVPTNPAPDLTNAFPLTTDALGGADTIVTVSPDSTVTATTLIYNQVLDSSGATVGSVTALIPSPSPVPEPSTFTLTAIAIVGLAVGDRRRRGLARVTAAS